MTEQLHFHFSLSCIGEGNGNPLQYTCLENPRDRGAWWAAVYGVTQSRTRLKQLNRSSSMPEPVMLKKLKLNSSKKPYKSSQKQHQKKKKDLRFYHRGLECKSTKSRDTWSNGQYDLVQNEAEQRLTEFYQENALVIANTLSQQYKRRLYTWTSLDGQYQNQIDYILCSQRWRSSIQLAKMRLGADCGSDHELLIAKLSLKLKKVGEATRPFRYDLNQILYDYTVK